MAPRTPQYGNRHPTSLKASLTGRGNKRSGTRPERLLVRALRRLGIRTHLPNRHLPGNPDVVFWKRHLVVFCDGDFWHGKDWQQRRRKLKAGSNSSYWLRKLEYNRQRDRQNTRLLRKEGWGVIRLWESDIVSDPLGSASKVRDALHNGTENRDWKRPK
jgi:DNA mismatch endonuclease (patch repair protein)